MRYFQETSQESYCKIKFICRFLISVFCSIWLTTLLFIVCIYPTIIYSIQDTEFRNSLQIMNYSILKVSSRHDHILGTVQVITPEQTLICNDKILTECSSMEDCSRKEWDYKKYSGTLLRGYYQLYPRETVLCNRIYFKPSLQNPNPPYIVVFLCCLVMSVISIYLWIILLCKSKCCNEPTESLRNHQRRPRIQYIPNPVHQHFHFHIEIPSNYNCRSIIQSLQENKSSRKIPFQEDSICCISLEIIEEQEEYIHCKKCNKNFIAESLLEWLRVNPQCPHCRTMMTQENIQLFQNQ